MDAQFSCRNGHGWSVRIEGPTAINGRWVSCPVCGAPPRPMGPVTAWQRLGRWAQRNPAALGMAASVTVLLATLGLIASMQWRDLTGRVKRAEAEVEKALIDAEAWRRQALDPRKTIVQRDGSE
jgi:hypothetical protein